MNESKAWFRKLTRFDIALLAMSLVLLAIAFQKAKAARSCQLSRRIQRNFLSTQEQDLVNLATDSLHPITMGTKDSLELLCKRKPDLASVHLALARIAARQGDRFHAARAYHAAITADPNLVDAKVPHSISIELKNFLVVAYPQIDAAHQKHPDDDQIEETWSLTNHSKRMLAGGCE